jgi:diamine N-acetyltransferase
VTLIRGSLVTLRPAVLADRRAVYEWMALSDLTASMMGPPLFPEIPVPTWDEHCSDYVDYFFDGTRPDLGRSFIIEAGGAAVGHISYSNTTLSLRLTELDIWLLDGSACGRGYGSDALSALCEHLHRTLGITDFYLRPSERNPRAIRAYRRAGFVESSADPALGPNESEDTVVLLRRLP